MRVSTTRLPSPRFPAHTRAQVTEKNGRKVVKTFPSPLSSALEATAFTGFSVEVVLQEGKPATQGAQFKQDKVEGECVSAVCYVCRVLCAVRCMRCVFCVSFALCFVCQYCALRACCVRCAVLHVMRLACSSVLCVSVRMCVGVRCATHRSSQGRVCLVLAAGNVDVGGALDCVCKLYSENQVCNLAVVCLFCLSV